MTKQINELPATTGIEVTDLLATKKGTDDYKVTITQLADLIRGGIAAADMMSLIQTLDSDTSGLNANFLQGNTSSYFTNASNLATGTVANARLPNGSFTSSVLTTSSKNYVQFPIFMFGLQRIMIQFGVTDYYRADRSVTVTFPVPFSSGFTDEVEPIVLLSPQCKRNGWSGATGSSSPTADVEADIRLWYADLSQFKASSIRTTGSEADTVRANWLAIGKY